MCLDRCLIRAYPDIANVGSSFMFGCLSELLARPEQAKTGVGGGYIFAFRLICAPPRRAAGSLEPPA